MSFKGNTGANELAKVLSERMQREGEKPLSMEYGKVHGDYSLKTDTFTEPIPKSDYLVCRGISETVQPEDRVLVVWVGGDAVVIDSIVAAGSV